MQWPIDEKEPNIGADCLACFIGDQAPEVVIVSFSDILKGDLWGPGDPSPPNEQFELTQTDPCTWVGNFRGFTCTWSIGFGQSAIWFQIDAPTRAFFQIGANCQHSYENFLNVPAGNFYYGGQCLITFAFPGNGFTIGSLAEAFGIPVDSSVNSLVYAIENDVQVVKFQESTKNIKVSIKRDFT